MYEKWRIGNIEQKCFYLEGKHYLQPHQKDWAVYLKLLADHGAHLILMAWSEEKLEEARLSSRNPKKHSQTLALEFMKNMK